MARNPDLDLSCLDDVDEPMVDIDGEMGVEKVVVQDVELEKVVEQNEGSDREIEVPADVEGGQLIDLTNLVL